MAEVVLAQGQYASGLASMLGTLLAQNVEQHPEKLDDFRGMAGDVVFEVPDLGEAVTLRFSGDRCTVYNGPVGNPRLRLRTDSEMLLALGLVRIGPLGLPNYMDGNGRTVLRAMFSGRLRITGRRHIRTLNRLTRLFSVV